MRLCQCGFLLLSEVPWQQETLAAKGSSVRVAVLAADRDGGLVWTRNTLRLGQYCVTWPLDRFQITSKRCEVFHPKHY